MTVALAVVAGALGSVCRFVVARTATLWLPPRRSSQGIWLVNVSGAFLLGLLVGARDAATLDHEIATVLGTGFLGGFTTFSTWMVDVTTSSISPRRAAAGKRAAIELGVPLVLGLLAAAGGLWLAG